ncbi:MAG: ABC transporter substrate-binding protein [Gammaproteobacteria bacterium]|nr:ABC transporter substrate-binding protein [Gammaproteobacteria bacterium]
MTPRHLIRLLPVGLAGVLAWSTAWPQTSVQTPAQTPAGSSAPRLSTIQPPAAAAPIAVTPNALVDELLGAFGLRAVVDGADDAATPSPAPSAPAVVLSRLMNVPDYAGRVAGEYYERLDDSYRQRLQRRLVRDMVERLAALLRDPGTLRVQPLPATAGDTPGEAHVTVMVDTDSTVHQVGLDFAWQRDQGWRLVDVGANGASAGAYYHQTYTDLFKRYGPAVALHEPGDG